MSVSATNRGTERVIAALGWSRVLAGEQRVEQVPGLRDADDVDHALGDPAFGMDRAGGEDELVARAELDAVSVLVEEVARPLEHVAAVVDVVPVERQLLHPFRHVRRRPQIEPCDVGEHLLLGVGAALARQELLSAFTQWLARTKSIELARPLTVPVHEPSFILFPMKELPLRFEAT